MKTILATCIAAIGLSLGGCAVDVVDRGHDDRTYYTAGDRYYRPGYSAYPQHRYHGYAPHHRYGPNYRYDRRPVTYYDNRRDGIPDRVIVRPGANPRIIVRD
jgi:hypothetical protein